MNFADEGVNEKGNEALTLLSTLKFNGFDLSLSFSLVNTIRDSCYSFQSKAPLENYVANIEIDLRSEILDLRLALMEDKKGKMEDVLD